MTIEVASGPPSDEDYGLSQKDGEAIKQWLLKCPDTFLVEVIGGFKLIDTEIAKNIEWQKKADDYLKSNR